MKVLMIINDMAWFWSHRLPLARGIVNRQWQLCVAAAGAAQNGKLKEAGMAGIDLPPPGGLLSHFRIFFAILRAIRREQPDIIHAITIRYAFYTAIAARLLGYQPVLFTLAGLGSLFTGTSVLSRMLRPAVIVLCRFAFNQTGVHIIFQNKDDRDLMLTARVIRADKTSVIRGSGVDLDEFSYCEEAPQTVPVILYAGRLIKEKGIGEFVDAARQIRGKGVNARFLVAGDYYPANPHSLDPAVMDQWVQEGVIEWLGQVADMPSLLRKTAIVTLPSYYGEGVPKCLLEAAATGRAIITTDMPGCRETVVAGETGLLIPPCDSDALALAIETLLADPPKRQAMGRAGRALITRDFAVETVVSRTLAVYDRVLTGQEGENAESQTAYSSGLK